MSKAPLPVPITDRDKEGHLVLTLDGTTGLEIGGLKVYLRQVMSAKSVRLAIIGPRDIQVGRFKWAPDGKG